MTSCDERETTAAPPLVSRCEGVLALAAAHPHPRDARVTFVESTHKYYVDGACMGTSVTGLIHGVTREPFDAEGVAAKLAARPSKKYNAGADPATGALRPLSARAILDMWDARRDLGTDLHGKIERHLNGLPVEFGPPDPATDNRAEFDQFLRWFATCGLEAYRTEWVIFDEAADVAGSIDFVGRNPVTGQLVIVDWKRCAHGRWESGFASNYNGATMLPPADYMEECKLSHWALQTNIYRKILEDNYGVAIEAMMMVVLYPGQTDAVVYSHARDDLAAGAILQARRKARADAGTPAAPAPEM
jgi:hypothetical protein